MTLHDYGAWVTGCSAAMVNMLCHTQYSDLCYGFNAFWRCHVPVLGLDAESVTPDGSGRPLWGDGFEVETLINIRIAQAGLDIEEVPSHEHSRIHGVSNLNALVTASAFCAPSSPSATIPRTESQLQ